MNEDSVKSHGWISQSSSNETAPLDMGVRKNYRDEVIKHICYMVLGLPLPFTTCNDPLFRNMMYSLNPKTRAILDELDPRTLKSEVMKIVDAEKDIVIDEIAKAPGRMSLTFDIWENDMDGQYLCLMAYWIDANWKLQRRMICFIAPRHPFPGPFADGLYVADEVATLLAEWKVDKKAMTLTLTNPNETMVASLKAHLLSSGSLLCNGDFFQVRCVSEVITLVVEGCLKLIDDVLDKVSRMAYCIQNSSSKIKNFYGTAEKNFHLNTNKRLHADFENSWDSGFRMIDRALYFKPVLDHSMQSDEALKSFEPSGDDWEKLDLVHKFLKIFFDVPSQYFSCKQSTLNVSFRGIWDIQRKLLEASKAPHDFMMKTVKMAKEIFDKYWSDHNLILSCAAVLDPRCKLEFVEYCHGKLYGEDYAEDMMQKVKTTLYKLCEDYKPLGSVSSSTNDDMMDYLGDGFEDYEIFLRKRPKLENAKSQLEFYLEERNLDLNKDIDILSFWGNLSYHSPELASLARDILVIPIFSVPPEAAFCMGEKMIKSWQRFLLPETIQATVCCQDWLSQKGVYAGIYSEFSTEMEDSDPENGFEDESD